MYKLLIVEDEDLIRNAILFGIDWPSLGLEVQGAEDGEIALETVRSFCPDIVLTDIRMPFIDGLELTRRLQEEYPRIIVIILSAKGFVLQGESWFLCLWLHLGKDSLHPCSFSHFEHLISVGHLLLVESTRFVQPVFGQRGSRDIESALYDILDAL